MNNRDMFYQGGFLIPNMNDFDNRINALQNQIKNLEIRISKLESINNEVTDNVYMI